MSTQHCPAVTPRGANNEELIACSIAAADHGITIRHGRMSTNGELRFRLNCSDGSAYIRTQTADGSQGWQNPHFHKRVRETYIVEKGWIGYAELRKGKYCQKSFLAGQVFTTEPTVVHNIFMPSCAVIHTVKHGADNNNLEVADWFGGESHPETVQLAKLHGPNWSGPIPTGGQMDARARADDDPQTDPEKLYNAAYRHFDTLIWQAPTWSSALFAVVVASVNSLLTKKPDALSGPGGETVNSVATVFGMSTNQFAASQLTLFGVFTLILAYALYRFRWHQIAVKSWSRDSESPRVSPQVLLQLVITVEAAVLLLVAAALSGFSVRESAIALTVILGYATYRWESKLAKRQVDMHPPTRRSEDSPRKTESQGGS